MGRKVNQCIWILLAWLLPVWIAPGLAQDQSVEAESIDPGMPEAVSPRASETVPIATPETSPVESEGVSSNPAANQPELMPFPVAPSVPEQTPPLVDPAQEIAPAVIELVPGSEHISRVMALEMYQELVSLIGRFESAQLMMASLDQPTPVSIAEDPISSNATGLSASLDPVAAAPHPALLEARTLLDEWYALLAAGDYEQARDRWETARQGLWDSFPRGRPFAQPEVRAVWLDRGSIVEASDRDGLARLFDRLAAAGFNTVFFETVNAGYPIYPSRLTPQNPLTVRWDPLAAAVELAHERGMELHAWVWTFAAGNQVHNRLLNFPENYLGPMLALNPGWAAYDHLGNPIPRGQTKPFYDPANSEVRSFLMRLFSEIISRYEVDGLHLDYIRYPFQNPGAGRSYGYGNTARWRFMASNLVDPVELTSRPDPRADRTTQQRQRYLWDRWTEFRIRQVNSFLYDVSQMVRRRRPDVTLSAAVFPKPENERLQKIQQDWGTWAREGYLDWIVLMSYAADTRRFEQLIQPWILEEDFGSTLILPSIRLLDLPSYAALDQIQAARDLPTPGYAVFAATDFNGELETVLAETQGIAPAQMPLPQQAPYQTVLERYQGLQREWNWLFSQGQMWVTQAQRDNWLTLVNSLEASLQSLASDPSARELEAARSQLSQLQATLDSGIAVGAMASAYRLQAWQYRLATLERLLAYSDRAQR